MRIAAETVADTPGTRTSPLLSVSLTVDYENRPNTLRDVAFSLAPGEILALVGQSGSGKSTLALALLGLLTWRGGKARGEIRFQGRDLMQLSESQMRDLRGREIALVPQSPIAALNPALRLRRQFAEAWRAHSKDRDGWKGRLQPLLASVQLPPGEDFLDRYPRQLSVGLAQRVMIAMALLHRPSLLIADEPTSALDAITQAEILELFARLNRELRSSMLFISHDLLSVASLSHRVAILHQGELVEIGPTRQIFANPTHPYTRSLIGALPANPYR